MADYDVGVLALVVPAKSAPRATYRPAVSVRNNGIHDALASGYLRIYAAGLLDFETELYSGTIVPGATGQAQAVDYWTPKTAGFYVIHAYLSTPLDQVEPNNMFQPVTIEITAEAPPTPPTVPAHAAQHEEGSADEVSIDGLQGRAADPQSPLDHAAQHQAGGSDALNVGSLAGVLAQDQPAQVHSNTRHNPVMSTAAELTSHAGSVAVHTAATNLANRETTGIETGLVKGVQLAYGSEFPNHDRMALLMNRKWGHPRQAALGLNMPTVHIHPSTSPLDIITLPVPAAWLSANMQFILESHGFIHSQSSADASIVIDLLIGEDLILSCPVDLSGAASHIIKISAALLGRTVISADAYIDIYSMDHADFGTILSPAYTPAPVAYTAVTTDLHLRCSVSSPDPALYYNSYCSLIRALHPIP